MMRAAVFTLGLLALGTPIPAQADTFLIHRWRWQFFHELLEMDDQGRIVGSFAALPLGFTPDQLLNSPDNRSVQVLGSMGTTPALLECDRHGAVTTVVSGAPLRRPVVLARNDLGDAFILDDGGGPGTWEVLRLRAGTLTRMCALAADRVTGARMDPETGLLAIRAFWPGPVQGYFRVDPATGTVTTVAAYGPGSQETAEGAIRFAYDAAQGAFVDFSYDARNQGSNLVLVHPVQGIVKIAPLGPTTVGFDMVEAGGRAAPIRYYVYGHQSQAARDVFIHVAGDGTVLRILTVTGTPWIGRTPLLRKRSNHLEWFLAQAPNDRVLRLSFPQEPGRNFVVGFSFTGMRPGVFLPDGRHLPLALDPLTVLCVSGGIPGLITNTVGALSAAGETAVHVNLNRLGPEARGITLWAAAVVLDPGAPFGIAHIAGPEALVLR
jgi:hypothetical protein